MPWLQAACSMAMPTAGMPHSLAFCASVRCRQVMPPSQLLLHASQLLQSFQMASMQAPRLQLCLRLIAHGHHICTFVIYVYMNMYICISIYRHYRESYTVHFYLVDEESSTTGPWHVLQGTISSLCRGSQGAPPGVGICAMCRSRVFWPPSHLIIKLHNRINHHNINNSNIIAIIGITLPITIIYLYVVMIIVVGRLCQATCSCTCSTPSTRTTRKAWAQGNRLAVVG